MKIVGDVDIVPPFLLLAIHLHNVSPSPFFSKGFTTSTTATATTSIERERAGDLGLPRPLETNYWVAE